jgi:hypothetical protein
MSVYLATNAIRAREKAKFWLQTLKRVRENTKNNYFKTLVKQ